MRSLQAENAQLNEAYAAALQTPALDRNQVDPQVSDIRRATMQQTIRHTMRTLRFKLPALSPRDLDAMLGSSACNVDSTSSVVRGLASGFLPGVSGAVAVRTGIHRHNEAWSDELSKRWLREVQICISLQHKHLVPVLAVCASSLSLVYPWAELGSLAGMLGAQREGREERTGQWATQRLQLLIGVAKGLAYLHRKGLVHRNVCSEKVLIFQEEDAGEVVARLGGLGWACEASHGVPAETLSLAGAPSHADPTQLSGGRSPEPDSDVFSLGVVVLEVLLGQAAADVARCADTSLGGTMRCTRRMRPLPLWADFQNRVASVQGRVVNQCATAEAAANVVREADSVIRDTNWARDALLEVAGLVSEMLSLEPAARPSAAAVAKRLEKAASLQAAKQEARSARKCVICLDERANARLQPCGHAALCETCAVHCFARDENKCPICRVSVVDFEIGHFDRTFAA